MSSAAVPADHVALYADQETLAAEQEKSKLKKHFGRFDMLFFLICTLVGVDTLGAVANNGPEGFTWLIFLAIFFFVPYAFLTAELGSAFTGEGGCYVWTRLAFGRFVAAINTVLYWLSNPVWMGGLLCITAVTTFNTFFGDLGNVGKYLFALAFIWFGVWAAILSFGVGKWIPTLGAWARIALLGVLLAQRRRLRVLERPARAGGRRLLAVLRAVHRARPAAVLQLRRLRAAQRRRRRDEGPAAATCRSRSCARRSRRCCSTASRSSRSSWSCRATRSPASAASSTR